MNLIEKTKSCSTTSMINNITNICIENQLPLSLQHTAVVFLKRATSKMKKDENVINFVNDEKYFVRCCISLAMKAENILININYQDFENKFKGNIDDENIKNIDLKNIDIKEEKNLFKDNSDGEYILSELIEYKYHVPCPYLRVLSMLIVLQERGIIKIDEEGRIIKNENLDNKNHRSNYSKDTECEGLSLNNINNRLCMKRNKRDVIFIDDIWNNAVCNIQRFIMFDDYLEFTALEVATAAIEIELENVGALDLKKEFREDAVNILKMRR
ncbi:hypothetical protein DMUE_0923 [Dictyocoela muelleri]|nr:hypothetical protein DMUE_0923 [Dictyocoela muelleri]